MPVSPLDTVATPADLTDLLTTYMAVLASGVHGVYDPRDYGAVYDGTTDDSAAIQAAIDAAATASGGIVVLSAQSGVSDTSRRIKVNTTLTVKAGVWLRGLGPTTVLTGSASPMISTPTSGSKVDRVTISDLFLQSPVGIGVQLTASGTTGGTQLGWARVTVQNVTVVDAGSSAFKVASGMIEQRLINCVSLRAATHGFDVAETDNFLIGCTSAESVAGAGYFVQGGNNKLSACKGYGNALEGFRLRGSGRHVLSGCEAQDNVGAGYDLDGNWNTLSGCLSDSDGAAGFSVASGSHVIQGCTAMYGGGGSGQVTPIGFRVVGDGSGTRISGITNCATPVSGALSGVGVEVKGAGNAVQSVAYASTITPDPYAGATISVLLTGNVTIANPTSYYLGQRMRLILNQDLTGGRTVTYGSAFRATSVPTTAATATVVDFTYDGKAWVQTAISTQTSSSPNIGDTFTRADSSSTLGSTEGTTATAWTARSGTWGISSNRAYAPVGSFPIATVSSGASDCTIGVTVVTGLTANNCRPAIVFRYQDSSNYWFWNVRDARLVKVVAGSSTTTTTPGLSATTDNSVCVVRLTGSTIELSVNGGSTFGFSTSDSALSSATSHGLGVTNDFGTPSNARFDGFSIT